jgi:hypothetical protein
MNHSASDRRSVPWQAGSEALRPHGRSPAHPALVLSRDVNRKVFYAGETELGYRGQQAWEHR